jgi:hypothetical protein
MLKLIISLFGYFILTISSELNENHALLCKNCGHTLAHVNDFIYKKSPMSLQIWNETALFHTHANPKSMYYQASNTNQTHKHEKSSNHPHHATIQLLKNPHGVTFEVVTLRRADLLLLNDTKSLQDTWFPNFKWTIGLCPHCMAHIGWHFESVVGEEGFFAIVLDKLLNAQFADSLIVEPKFKVA